MDNLDDKEVQELLAQAEKRRRVNTTVRPFADNIKALMSQDVSLPLICEWLETKGAKTTLPALRRFIRKQFGDSFYDEFMARNGWAKNVKGKVKSADIKPAKPAESSQGHGDARQGEKTFKVQQPKSFSHNPSKNPFADGDEN